jgi:steroid 5-alpha reductase family enzyme
MTKDEGKKSILSYIYGPIAAILLFILAQGIAYLYSGKDSRKLNYIVVFVFLTQWIAFIFASGILGNTPTEKYYDITGSFTYIVTLITSYITLSAPSKRQMLVILAALIWSARLGIFLFMRISRSGNDRRFAEIKTNFSSFLIAWTLQGVWVFLTLLSILAICQLEDTSNFNLLNYIGMGVWTMGFFFEVIADHQKSVFNSDPKNQGKFISSGLWSLSRHPNYFGEISMWIGISMICYNKTISSIKLLISPIFVALLLIFVSGIPMLEDHANQKFAGNQEYLNYKENTPVLFPFIGRSGNASF